MLILTSTKPLNFLSQKGANENMRSYTLKVTLTLQNKLILSHLRLDPKIVDIHCSAVYGRKLVPAGINQGPYTCGQLNRRGPTD